MSTSNFPGVVETISKKKARAIALSASGLHKKSAFGKGKSGARRMLDHLGYVQIDTISVIMRAHHHVFSSRVPGYTPKHIHTMQSVDCSLFEYWAHAAAYLPISDFRFSQPIKDRFRTRKDGWPKPSKEIMKKVLHRVKEEGPLMARDFESSGTNNQGWWDWKPAKRALERLFLEGELMISKRRGFQKVYDLTERVLPEGVNTKFPSKTEYADHLIRRSIKSLGIVTAKEITYLRKGIKGEVNKRLKEQVEDGTIDRIHVRGLEGQDYFTARQLMTQNHRISKILRFLSPFDNCTIQRDRLQKLFDFDYVIECYVPADKRKYGYFCLPALYGDRFIGRVDMKADRKDNTLIVQNLALDSKWNDSDIPAKVWTDTIGSFARENGCRYVKIQGSSDPSLRQVIIDHFHRDQI